MPKTAEATKALRACLLCDDIRTEENGKLILVGVYTGHVVVPSWPTTMVFTPYVELELSAGDHPVDIQIRFDGAVLAGMRGTLEVLETGRIGFPAGKLPVRLEREGTLSVHVQLDEAEWVLALSKKIILEVDDDDDDEGDSSNSGT